MWLRYFYHFLVAILISGVLLITTIVMDIVLQYTHLTQLLLNIDFLIDPKKVPTIIEGLIHLSIGFVIYIVFLVIYLVSRPLYHLAYIPYLLSLSSCTHF